MAGDSAAKPPKPDPRLMRRFPLFADMMEPARRRCPRRIGEYWLGGADTEAGLRENAAAFQRIRLVPRYGLDIARRSSRVDLLGRTYAAPVGVSPAGFMDAFWPGSEMALAAAAERANLPFILSTYSIEPLEAIARAAPSVGWFQLYTFMTMERTLDLAKRAERAGYQVLVLTIDIPVYSKRTRDYRTALEFPPRPSLSLALELLAAPVWSYRLLRKGYPLPGNLMPYAPAGLSREGTLRAVLDPAESFTLTWDEVKRLRKAWPGKLVVKGLQHPADALTAVELGADGIIVSNHGGRQLDAAPASVDSLPQVAAAVDGRAAVMIDGGVRSGLDVVRAVVRGADCAFTARCFIAACAAMGLEGADFAMALFNEEIATAMGQIGAVSPGALKGDAAFESRPDGQARWVAPNAARLS